MKFNRFMLAAGTLLVAAPAHAQFTGPRIEARLAYDSVEAAIENGDPFATADGESAISYGGELGYDVQLGSVVVGAYAGLEGSNLRTCNQVFGNDEGCIGQGRNLYVGARAGVAIAPRVLIFGKAGYSNGSIDVSYDGSGFDDFAVNEDFGGHHLGIGGEIAVAAGLYGRIEYVHTDYGEFQFDADEVGKFARGQLMVGAGLRF